MLVFLIRRVRWKRSLAAAARLRTAAWFDQLLAVLVPRGIAPAPGDTPWEFAQLASDKLSREPATATVADVPIEWVEAHYRQRFGGEPISEERKLELAARLAALQQAQGERGRLNHR